MAFDIAHDIADISNMVYESKKPSKFVTGYVLDDEYNGKELLIGLDLFNALPKASVVIPEYLTDHEVVMDYECPGSCPDGFSPCPTRKKVRIINHLVKGEKVIMLQNEGMQSYLVITRTGGRIFDT